MLTTIILIIQALVALFLFVIFSIELANKNITSYKTLLDDDNGFVIKFLGVQDLLPLGKALKILIYIAAFIIVTINLCFGNLVPKIMRKVIYKS